MTDYPEDTWMKRDFVTHQDLADESAAIVKALRKEHAKDMDVIRGQIALLDESKTVAIMAAILYGKCTEAEPEFVAKMLYRNTQKTLEIDQANHG